MNSKLLYFIFIFSAFFSHSQYTEIINSNRPGSSHGAFAVGVNVFQLETGISGHSLEHSNLNNSKIDGLNFNYLFRYGFLNEKLEVFLDGNIITRNILDNNYINNYSTDIKETIIGKQTLGFKYLFFDPYKNKKWHGENVYSWNAGRKIKLTDFIPAISAIVGSSFNFDDRIQYDDLFFKVKQPLHPDLFNDGIIRSINFYQPEQTISPFIGLATQHHFKGRWVVVNNFFYELGLKNPTIPSNVEPNDYSKINYLFTITYNLQNPKWSIFGEFQTFKNKTYSDDLFKFGIANLISKNSQIDLNFGGSFKTTPSYTYINVGFSQRFDWHKDISEEEKQAKKDFNIELKQRRKQQKVEKKINKKSSKKIKTNPKKLAKKENRKSKKSVNKSLKQNKKQLKKEEKALRKMNKK
ncbi:MAG: transporter [Flavobacteriaceae bacterium]